MSLYFPKIFASSDPILEMKRWSRWASRAVSRISNERILRRAVLRMRRHGNHCRRAGADAFRWRRHHIKPAPRQMRPVTDERSVSRDDIRAFPQRDGEKPRLIVQSHIDVFQGDILTEYPAGDSHMVIVLPVQEIEVAVCRLLQANGNFVHRAIRSARVFGLTTNK